MGDGPVLTVLHGAVDVRLRGRRAALHDLAGVHAALAGVRGAPVHPGALVSNWKQLVLTVRQIVENSQAIDCHGANHHVNIFWFQAIKELPPQADSFKVHKHSSEDLKSILRNHLALDQVPVPLAVHLLVVQEHAVRGPRAHEVVVAGAGGEAAAHGGTRLLAELASQLLAPDHSHVHVLQGPVIVLKHFCRPQSAVHMCPLILANVQQAAGIIGTVIAVSQT